MTQKEMKERQTLRMMVNDYCIYRLQNEMPCTECPGLKKAVCTGNNFFFKQDIRTLRKEVDNLIYGEGVLMSDDYKNWNPKGAEASPVCLCDENGNVLEIYASISEAAKATHINPVTIRRACKGVAKNPRKGFWRWADE